MADIDMRVTEAMHRIEELYYETDGKCYVSFSGGKDSTVLLALIKLCEDIYTIPTNGIPAVFCDTGIELGVTTDFVRWCKKNWYTNIEMVRPEHSFDWVLKNHGKPMKSKIKSEIMHRWHTGKRTEYVTQTLLDGIMPKSGKRMRTRIADKDLHMLSDNFSILPSPACCTVLKKDTAEKWSQDHAMKGSIVGIRLEEGGVRKMQAERRAKNGGKICTFQAHGKTKKAPIIDWSESDVDEFVSKYNVPLSDAYTKYGFFRTGCMACPFAWDLPHDLKYLHDYEPNRYKAAMHWLKDVYIAQNVVLPFDEAYERERERTWRELYEPMRQEMLRKYRPNSRLIKDGEQLSLFD